MKRSLFAFASLSIVSLFVSVSSAHMEIPHWDLEMSGAEYRPLVEMHQRQFGSSSRLRPVYALGVRNLEWLKHINSKSGMQLSFSNKANTRAIPIDQANETNEAIILADMVELKSLLPDEMSVVLLNGAPFSDLPPLPVNQYLEWGLRIDRLYQSAARWDLLEPYRIFLIQRRQDDIRGYYFLSRLNNRSEILKNLLHQSPDRQTEIKNWLIGMCHNSGQNLSQCQTNLNLVLQNGDANPFFQSHLRASQEKYDSFFRLNVRRNDLIWSSTLATLPFLNPTNPEVENFLRVNIEDEWQWNSWQLRLDFQNSGSHPHVVFKPGVTPNVNGLGGNRITMDANTPLTEWAAQWTIRHEFGHVLGFQDCYVEFYDEDRDVIVNYQIDVDNLMCSRRGRIQETHFQELENVY